MAPGCFFCIRLHSSYIAYGTSAIFPTTSMTSKCAPAPVFYCTTLLAVPTSSSRPSFWASSPHTFLSLLCCTLLSTTHEARHVHVINRVSAALDSGSIVDVDESRLSDLLAVRCLPDVQALHVGAVHQVCPLLEHVLIKRLVSDCSCYSRVFLCAFRPPDLKSRMADRVFLPHVQTL